MRGVIVEAGDCIYCGRHIDSNDDLFLCKNCRENEKEEKLKAVGTGMSRLERPAMGKDN